MMQLVPLSKNASQTLNVILGAQICKLNVYQRDYGLFVDIFANGQPIVIGVIGQDLNRMVRYAALGFAGDFIFVDAQGDEDPNYTGFGPGGRFELLYLTTDDLASLGFDA